MEPSLYEEHLIHQWRHQSSTFSNIWRIDFAHSCETEECWYNDTGISTQNKEDGVNNTQPPRIQLTNLDPRKRFFICLNSGKYHICFFQNNNNNNPKNDDRGVDIVPCPCLYVRHDFPQHIRRSNNTSLTSSRSSGDDTSNHDNRISISSTILKKSNALKKRTNSFIDFVNTNQIEEDLNGSNNGQTFSLSHVPKRYYCCFSNVELGFDFAPEEWKDESETVRLLENKPGSIRSSTMLTEKKNYSSSSQHRTTPFDSHIADDFDIVQYKYRNSAYYREDWDDEDCDDDDDDNDERTTPCKDDGHHKTVQNNGPFSVLLTSSLYPSSKESSRTKPTIDGANISPMNKDVHKPHHKRKGRGSRTKKNSTSIKSTSSTKSKLKMTVPSHTNRLVPKLIFHDPSHRRPSSSPSRHAFKVDGELIRTINHNSKRRCLDIMANPSKRRHIFVFCSHDKTEEERLIYYGASHPIAKGRWRELSSTWPSRIKPVHTGGNVSGDNGHPNSSNMETHIPVYDIDFQRRLFDEDEFYSLSTKKTIHDPVKTMIPVPTDENWDLLDTLLTESFYTSEHILSTWDDIKNQNRAEQDPFHHSDDRSGVEYDEIENRSTVAYITMKELPYLACDYHWDNVLFEPSGIIDAFIPEILETFMEEDIRIDSQVNSDTSTSTSAASPQKSQQQQLMYQPKHHSGVYIPGSQNDNQEVSQHVHHNDITPAVNVPRIDNSVQSSPSSSSSSLFPAMDAEHESKWRSIHVTTKQSIEEGICALIRTMDGNIGINGFSKSVDTSVRSFYRQLELNHALTDNLQNGDREDDDAMIVDCEESSTQEQKIKNLSVITFLSLFIILLSQSILTKHFQEADIKISKKRGTKTISFTLSELLRIKKTDVMTQLIESLKAATKENRLSYWTRSRTPSTDEASPIPIPSSYSKPNLVAFSNSIENRLNRRLVTELIDLPCQNIHPCILSEYWHMAQNEINDS